MRKLAIIAISVLVLASCSPDRAVRQGDIHHISISVEYADSNSPLETVLEQDALVDQLERIADCSGRGFHSYEFRENAQGGLTFTGSLSIPSGTPEEMILSAIDELREVTAGTDDLVVFSYSGHGKDPDGSFCFDPAGSTTSVGTVTDALKSFDTTVLMILDSCFSGNASAETNSGMADGNIYTDDAEPLLDSISYFEALGKAFTLSVGSGSNDDLWVLAATSAYQQSWGDTDKAEYPMGDFSKGILRALGYDLENHQAADPEWNTMTFYQLQKEACRYLEEIGALSSQTSSPTLSPVDIVLFSL